MAFKIGQPVGLAAKRAALEKQDALVKTDDPLSSYKETIKAMPPEEMADRIGIVFDDSSSMYGQKIEDAKVGVEEFLKCCRPGATAVAVYPFAKNKKINLCSDLLAVAIKVKSEFSADESTPLYTTSMRMLESEKLTRAIIFSDGFPTDGNKYGTESPGEQALINLAKEKKIPIDTVYIGSKTNTGPIELMRRIAEATGGVFLIFDPGKTYFRNSFKYLAPAYRALLTDKSFVEDLQNGKR